MKSRILLAVSISVFLVLYYTKEGKACFSPPTEYAEYRFGLFAPYSAHLRMYDGMYFSYFFMHDYQNQMGVDRDHEKNVNEWYAYLGRKVDKSAIDALLYHVTPAEFSELLYPKGNLQDYSLSHNSFFKYIRRPENKRVFDYICFAKLCESNTSGGDIDPWDDDFYIGPRQEYSSEAIDSVVASLGPDNFLKARYLYLQIRGRFPRLNGRSEMLISQIPQVYEQLLKLPVKSVVKGWAAYFNALNESHDNFAKGNYLLAQAFELSDDKKSPCFRHFSADSLPATLKYARNAHELANIYALTAMKKPGDAISLIEKIYRLDPANPSLHFLMVREVSKLEDRIWSPKYTGFDAQVRAGISGYDAPFYGSADAAKDAIYLSKWASALSRMLADSLPKDRFFFNLCMAHTLLIKGQAQEAQTLLDEAQKYPPADAELLCQYKLTELAMKITLADTLTDKFETEILPALKWLDDNRAHLENADLVLKQLHLFLAKKYEQQGNRSRAILCRSRYNWFYYVNTVARAYYHDIDSSLYLYMQECCSGNDVEGFVNTLRKKNKSLFEKYYCHASGPGSYIYNMAANAAGSDYLREADYTSALRLFSLLPASYWREGHTGEVLNNNFSADPFLAYPEDNHQRSMTIKDSSQRYNEITFTRRLVKLLRYDAGKPDSLIRIADAVYNMTYFGNSWILVRNSWSRYDNAFDRTEWGPKNVLSPKYYDYYACRRARSLYQQVYYSAANRETKAKALLMMAQCDKNYAYLKNPKLKHQSTALFDQFAAKYADTRYYEDLTSECDITEVKGYFYQFIP